MSSDTDKHAAPLLCHRCGRTLHPGEGNFYVVQITAFADPTPPHLSAEDLQRDLRREMADLLAQLADRSEREGMDDVYRRLVIHLCGRCYRAWIENPAAAAPGQSAG